MERIRLSKEEKTVFRSVSINGKKLPLSCSPFLFVTTLDLLKEKGLVSYKADEDGVVYMAKLTIKGKAYMEYNPMLKNPIPWKDIILIMLSTITAVSTLLALFVGCTLLNERLWNGLN